MIALCGCMMQEPTVVEKIRSSYKFVNLVFGTHNIHKLPEILKEHTKSKKLEVNGYVYKKNYKSI